MTYVISNIHGNYSKFTEMLDKISFSDNDIMYVLGDIVDFGDETMEVVCDLSVRMNVYPVIGEHDARAYKMLSGFDKMLKNGGSPSADFISLISAIRRRGILYLNAWQKTLSSIKSLPTSLWVSAWWRPPCFRWAIPAPPPTPPVPASR